MFFWKYWHLASVTGYCADKRGFQTASWNSFVFSDTRKCFCATGHTRIQYKESAGLTTDSVAVVVQCSKKRAGSWKQCISSAGQRQIAKCQAIRLKRKGSSGDLLNWSTHCSLSLMSSPSSALLSVTSLPSRLSRALMSGTSL